MKINLALFLALVISALALVNSQHAALSRFVALEQANARAKQLEVEWAQLQLEQTRLAKHSLIDSVAKRDLKMQGVEPGRTLYVALPESDRPVAQRAPDAQREHRNAIPQPFPEVAAAKLNR